jgi:putative ABC transport system permease protein
VNLDFKPGVVIEDKKTEYSSKFNPAKVTDVEEYASQTFGDSQKQLNRITIAAVLIAIVLSVLITSFFLKMLTAKDARQIAIMRSLGLSQSDIRRQYLAKMLTVLLPGIILGMIAANTLGEMLAGVIMSNMGASKIEFIINPFQAYLLCPLGFIVTVTVTTILGIRTMKEANIRETISE